MPIIEVPVETDIRCECFFGHDLAEYPAFPVVQVLVLEEMYRHLSPLPFYVIGDPPSGGRAYSTQEMRRTPIETLASDGSLAVVSLDQTDTLKAKPLRIGRTVLRENPYTVTR